MRLAAYLCLLKASGWRFCVDACVFVCAKCVCVAQGYAFAVRRSAGWVKVLDRHVGLPHVPVLLEDDGVGEQNNGPGGVCAVVRACVRARVLCFVLLFL